MPGQCLARRRRLPDFFDLDGKRLWYSAYTERATLTHFEWVGGQSGDVRLPPLTRDAVAYLAQNPVDHHEYAIATFERSVYLSKDSGQSWQQIAERGRGR